MISLTDKGLSIKYDGDKPAWIIVKSVLNRQEAVFNFVRFESAGEKILTFNESEIKGYIAKGQNELTHVHVVCPIPEEILKAKKDKKKSKRKRPLKGKPAKAHSSWKHEY